MKKILLLTAIAAPMLMSAQGTTPAQPTEFLQYNLPAATFFTTDGAKAVVAPGTPLTWENTSYYLDQYNNAIDWTDGSFNWSYAGLVTSSRNLVTPASFTPVAAFNGKIANPYLQSADLGVTPFTSQVAVYPARIAGAASSTRFFQFNPAGKTKAADNALYTYDPSTGDLSTAWQEQVASNLSLNVTGFAQKLDYAGVPYILRSIDLGTQPSGSFRLEIYEVPADSSMTVPEQPIHFFEQNDPTQTATQVLELKLSTGEPMVIDRPVMIVFTDFTGEFKLPVYYQTIDAAKPAFGNQGAYVMAEVTDGQGVTTNRFIPSTQPTATITTGNNQNNVVVATGVSFGIEYPFIKALGVDGLGQVKEQPLTLTFDEIVGAASVIMATSQQPYINGNPNPEFIWPDNIPDWLTVTASNASDDANSGNFSMAWQTLGLTQDGTTPAVSFDNQQYCVLNFVVNSAVGGTADLTFGVPGAEATIKVDASAVSGIQGVTTPEAEVVGREYFDLSGRRLSGAPANGFYIEKLIRADGSSSSVSRVR